MAQNRYTVEEVAKAMQLSGRTIRRHIKAGTLPAAKPGREFIITRSDLVTYLGSEERVDALFGRLGSEQEGR